MSKMAKAVSVVGFVLSMILVSRYLYLLMSGDSQRFSEGNNGLWLTVGAVVIACIAGGLMFYFFLRHEDASSKASVPRGLGTTSARNALAVKCNTPQARDIKRGGKVHAQ